VEDYRAGILAALFRNVHRAKNSQPMQPEDFFPSLREANAVNGKGVKRGHTPEQLLAIFQIITGAEIKQ
jgi:hypothetical protein